LLTLRQITRVLPVILEDAIPNVMHNPLGLWKAGNLARRADLTAELEELKRRNMPVVVLWGDKDKIIPRASFDALCAAIGSQGEVVPGRHSWLLADPDAFGEVMTNSVAVAQLARQLEEEKSQAESEGLGKRLTRRISRTVGRDAAEPDPSGGESAVDRKAGSSDAQISPAAGDSGRV
jgi:hypothetical protein